MPIYNITKEDVLAAVEKIETEKKNLITSTKYDVIINGKAYPPKEIMRYANYEKNKSRYWDLPGGPQTNKYLEEMGFEIIQKKEAKTPLAEFKNNIKMENEKIYNIVNSLNTILYGPPGTGKTYHTINKAIAIANPPFDLSQGRTKIKEEYDRLIKNGQIVFTTFHQSMTYEDFIEGIKPEIDESEDSKSIVYDIHDGIFKQICQKAMS